MSQRPQSPMRLYVLDTGLVECADYDVRDGAVVRGYRIVHPRGTPIWDAGAGDSVAELPVARAPRSDERAVSNVP